MKKGTCLSYQMLLAIWFLFSMIGLRIGRYNIVEGEFHDEWMFMLFYLLAVLVFIVKTSLGKWILLIWTGLWFITQFLSHEWYTIFNNGFMGKVDGKISYFSGTVKLFSIDGRYVPDMYHIILHILILCVFITTLRFTIKQKKDKYIH